MIHGNTKEDLRNEEHIWEVKILHSIIWAEILLRW